LLGLAVLGREKGTRKWLLWPGVLELRKEIAVNLLSFKEDGDLVICEEPDQDVREIAALCAQLRDAGLLPEEESIGLDPAGVAAIVEELQDAEFTEADMKSIAQGYRLNGAILGAERKLRNRTLLHGGQPLLTWCVGNAKSEQKGNAVVITKETAGKAKIDPLVAMFDAIALMSRNPRDRSSPRSTSDQDRVPSSGAEPGVRQQRRGAAAEHRSRLRSCSTP
jgi:phage terminase large subunit-like protein